jgi:hypothetical protein
LTVPQTCVCAKSVLPEKKSATSSNERVSNSFFMVFTAFCSSKNTRKNDFSRG